MTVFSSTRSYTIPGFRIGLVREPGVNLSERPLLHTPAEAAPLLAQYIGDIDREAFAVAMITVRHRVVGLRTVPVACPNQLARARPLLMYCST